MAGPCPFCDAHAGRALLAENDVAFSLYDAFPVTPGHALIVSRRHVAALFVLTADEQLAVWALVAPVKAAIEAARTPDGYTIGVNVAEAAGQTVPHVHVHVIPRYAGDVADPRGGVRWVIPSRADYWSRRL